MHFRIFAIAICAFLLAAPALPAAARPLPHRAQCTRLTQQMARYARDAGWAAERENALWEQASMAQYQRLSNRRYRLCPYLRPKNPAEEFAKFLKKASRVAAELAIRYFTGGLGGLGGLKPF